MLLASPEHRARPPRLHVLGRPWDEEVMRTDGWAWLACLLSCALLACASHGTGPTVPAAVATQPRDEAKTPAANGDQTQPLVGRIWDTQARKFVDVESVLGRAAR